jgi:hypothetical protein
MKLLLAREDLLDEISECLSDTNDLDVEWHQFAEAVLKVLEGHGITFEEPEPPMRVGGGIS